MTVGTSLVLIAIGAILRFAVTVSTKGFNIHTVGVILLIIGVIGLILSLFWMSVWSRRRDRAVVAEPRAYDDRVPPRTY